VSSPNAPYSCLPRTAKQRLRLLPRYHQSQLTLKQFAARHGVGLSTLSKWLRLERDAAPTKVKFQEVQLPNPFDYLKDLFTHLPSAKITEIKQFTPAAWAKAKAKERLLAEAT